MVQTTYQKKNGELINKFTYINSAYKIGQTNGFGWKVVDIKYKFKDKYYPSYEYDNLVMKRNQRDAKINKIKRDIKNSYIYFIRFFAYIVLYKVLEFIFAR